MGIERGQSTEEMQKYKYITRAYRYLVPASYVVVLLLYAGKKARRRTTQHRKTHCTALRC